MTFTDAVKKILASNNEPMTPQEIREKIKATYPIHYGTPSHIRNVEKSHYKNIDHALLAQIYSLVRMNKFFVCDKGYKPIRISLNAHEAVPSQGSTVSSTEECMKNEDDLISNIDYYYKRSLEVLKDFGGPSIYFHVQSIKEQQTAFLSDRHIEMIYATLASWGMNRMGNPDETKAKMVEYSDFRQSILRHSERLRQYCSLQIDTCTQEQYGKYIDDLEQIYRTLKISIAEATIVAHSKTLAHILPNLIPPIDRQYTVRFFTQDNRQFFTKSGKFRLVSLPQGIDAQFADFKSYCCRIKTLFDRADRHSFIIDKETFNTSFPKIMDNLIMAFVKDVPKPDERAEGKHHNSYNVVETVMKGEQIPMTHAEQIFRAAMLAARENKGVFSREQVRQEIRVTREVWMAGYTAIFQGMRDDHPGGAPAPGSMFRAVFHRNQHGKYQMSDHGKRLAAKMGI